MKNVYDHNGTLVSILKKADDKNCLVISDKGVTSTVNSDELKPAKLYNQGIYHEKFFQAVLGGLLEPPKRVKASLSVYNGKYGIAVAEITDKDFVKYAIGLPDEAFGPGADRLDDLKINKDKEKDYDKDSGDDWMGELSTLDSMDDPMGETEELQISDDEPLGNLSKITITWENPAADVSISEIKNLFGEGQPLPDPDTIKVDTGEETVTRKKSWRERLTKTAAHRKAYYGPAPVMFHTCPKCQTMLVIDTKADRKPGDERRVIVRCPNPKCGYESLYEGSLPGHGASGQSKHN